MLTLGEKRDNGNFCGKSVSLETLKSKLTLQLMSSHPKDGRINSLSVV